MAETACCLQHWVANIYCTCVLVHREKAMQLCTVPVYCCVHGVSVMRWQLTFYLCVHCSVLCNVHGVNTCVCAAVAVTATTTGRLLLRLVYLLLPCRYLYSCSQWRVAFL